MKFDTFVIADHTKEAMNTVTQQSSAQTKQHADEKHAQAMRHRNEMHDQTMNMRSEAHAHNMAHAKKHHTSVAPEYLYGGGFNYNVVDDDDASESAGETSDSGDDAGSGGDSD